MNIAIVANEPSGDLLGASLIRQLKRLWPEARFFGVAGPQMLATGCETLVDQERLARMGLVEVVRHLPELLSIRAQLIRQLSQRKPQVFIGVDAPDFNLPLARKLREQGIPTVHLVSPTVWAWRAGRVKQLRRSLDLLLSLFPFEEAFLRAHGVPVRYIGHPLADEIPLHLDRAAIRRKLHLPLEDPIIALLPGSRNTEVQALTQPMLETARWCLAREPKLRFLVPLVSPNIRAQFEAILQTQGKGLPLLLLDGQSRAAIAAADAVLTASGTATLEALLLKRPMVVAYRIHPLTYWLVKTFRLVKVPHIAMANLLVGRAFAPEFLQEHCKAQEMGPPLLRFLRDREAVAEIQRAYERVHHDLRRQASHQAALAISELLGRT